MKETLFVFTNDDAGMQEPARFAELLDFLKAQAVPATFFTVPAWGEVPLDQQPDWPTLLERALTEGHELQHHGWVHTAFEFGVPPYFMLDIMPDGKAQWENDPAAITINHAQAILTDKLGRGREIFGKLFGLTPLGFRSPCLAICDNMYAVLRDLDFVWSSNQVVNPMGWRYINRNYDAGEPWQVAVPPHPFRHPSGLIEAPMQSEYTWYLTEADIDRHFQLAKDDFDRTRQAGGTFTVLSHYYAMTGQWAAGLKVYERLFAYARQQGHVRFVTLSQTIAAEERIL